MTKLRGNAAAAATPHPLPFGYCVFQHKQNAVFPLIRLAIARHLLPSGRRHLWSCVFSILGRTCQLSQSATPAFRIQLCPAGQRTAQLDARAGEARQKGESRKRTEESLLSSGRFRLSPATGRQSRLPVLFKQLSRHNAAFFGTFLGSKTVPSPLVPPFVPPRPPSPRKFRLPFAANCGNIKAITHWRCLRCRIRFCNRFRAPCRRISRI